METYSALLATTKVNPPITGELPKASDAQLWCVLLCAPEQKVEQTILLPVVRDAMTVIVTSV